MRKNNTLAHFENRDLTSILYRRGAESQEDGEKEVMGL
jgi:hypothetical protein